MKKQWMALAMAIIGIFILGGCGEFDGDTAQLKFDAHHSVLREANVANGRIITKVGIDDEQIQKEIMFQLKYATGVLNGIHSVIDMHDVEITIAKKKELQNDLQLVTYQMRTSIALAKEYENAKKLNLYLPQRGDAGFLYLFFQRLGRICVHRNPCLLYTSDAADE